MFRVSLGFAAADLWLGAFINFEGWRFFHNMKPRRVKRVFVCLIPCLPICFSWTEEAGAACVCLERIREPETAENSRHYWNCPQHGYLCRCGVD